MSPDPTRDAHAAFDGLREPPADLSWVTTECVCCPGEATHIRTRAKAARWLRARRTGLEVTLGILAAVALFWWLGALLVSGDAENARKADERRRDPSAAVNVCIAKGGIPINVGWYGDIERCDFPPKATP